MSGTWTPFGTDDSIEFELPAGCPPPLTKGELRLLAAVPTRTTRPVPTVTHRRAPRVHWFDEFEQAQLRRLVYQAFDLRESPYMVDACRAIVDWAERTLPDRLERRARRGRRV